MTEFNIKGFVDISLVDWDGKLSSVIFLPNCNFRCPFCQNARLVLKPDEMPTISFDEVKSRLERLKKWIDGVVITGGEPTIHESLELLCEKVKALGFKVKLDTNGTRPEVMRKLIENKLVNYVALDVKAPLENRKYAEATGVDSSILLHKVLESIEILKQELVDYEFRTTLVPSIHSERDIEEICNFIGKCRKYALQNFRPTEDLIDQKFRKIKPFSRKELESFVKIARKYLSNVVLRF